MPAPASPPALLAIDDALALVVARAAPLGAEEVALGDAPGRVLAEDVAAVIALPPFTNSAMDGYAVRAADLPGTLPVAGESAAGAPYGATLRAGEAVTISTGAIVPDGADAIVPVEDTVREGGAVAVGAPVAPGAFVRRAGSDVGRGERVLTAGTRLGPAQIGAAAAAGHGTLRCARRPRVAVVTVGDELRPPGTDLSAGQIYDANRPMLAAALAGAGALVSQVPVAADTAAAHRAALAEALEHDVVISSGGVSVGEHDLVRGAARDLGVQELFWRVKLRPGKPLSFGVRDATLVFGLPGNPVSTLVCFELFVRPALLALQGVQDARPAFGAGVLGVDVARNAQRDDLIRVTIDRRDGATPVLVPLGGQESHQIAVAAQADGLARIPAGAGTLRAGDAVAYLPLGEDARGH
jgi:molybdopterin molybdotransferase